MSISANAARLYLDQKDWIALARLRGSNGGIGLGESAGVLRARIELGEIVTPLAESHVLEIGKIGNPSQRQDIATTIMLYSKRNALAPLQTLWKQEADAFMRGRLDAATVATPEPFGKGLAYALGFTDEELKLPWSPITPEAEITMAETFAMAEPNRHELSAADLERRNRWKEWARFITTASQALKEDRQKYNEHDRIAAVTLDMLGNDLLHRAIGLNVHDAFLEFLREQGPWAVVREMPSLGVLTELLRVRYPDTTVYWTANDYHDVRFLCVALAYCSAACPDRRWADLAWRSDYIALRGCVIAAGENALASALERIPGTAAG